ncbi:MarR family transcriptional regulator [Actinospica durhamensis]|uniref:MarR family transcriptional regulator n=1 Tax=Actinospica durhamensis TaxID=1508375 RepID=A0A941IQN9_9ACTN|nr:MarR family transcriptional regulator [Actinospica durhamensis]MBR7834432.1 MarR family transcriptional regulator [Actinospica durhamensis]
MVAIRTAADNAEHAASDTVPQEIVQIEKTLTEISYLRSRARQHERLMAVAGVHALDRSAISILRQLADCEPVRSGELAARLAVEASHVTRQVQALEKTGYVTRTPDPNDGRAQLIELTARGREAVERVRTAGRHGIRQALADWSAEDLHRLSVLFRRMYEDFVGHAEDPSEFQLPESAHDAPGSGAPAG